MGRVLKRTVLQAPFTVVSVSIFIAFHSTQGQAIHDRFK